MFKRASGVGLASPIATATALAHWLAGGITIPMAFCISVRGSVIAFGVALAIPQAWSVRIYTGRGWLLARALALLVVIPMV